MKLITENNIINRIPFFYDYFSSLKEKGIVNMTAKQMADDLKLENPQRLTKNLAKYIDKPGRKNYGYNVTYLQKEFTKLMMLERPIPILLIGELYPFIDMESLAKRNFTMVWNFTTKEIYDNKYTLQGLIEEIHKNAVVMLTMKVPDTMFHEVEEFASCIINLSGFIYENTKVPIYNFDIMDAVLCTWHQTVKKLYVTDDNDK